MKYWKDRYRDRKRNLLSIMETSILESPTCAQWTFQALATANLPLQLYRRLFFLSSLSHNNEKHPQIKDLLYFSL